MSYYCSWLRWKNTKSLNLKVHDVSVVGKKNLKTLHKFLRMNSPVKTLTDLRLERDQKREQAKSTSRYIFQSFFVVSQTNAIQDLYWKNSIGWLYVNFHHLANVFPRQTQDACLGFLVLTPAEST